MNGTTLLYVVSGTPLAQHERKTDSVASSDPDVLLAYHHALPVLAGFSSSLRKPQRRVIAASSPPHRALRCRLVAAWPTPHHAPTPPQESAETAPHPRPSATSSTSTSSTSSYSSSRDHLARIGSSNGSDNIPSTVGCKFSP
jgi:hypothetical protein